MNTRTSTLDPFAAGAAGALPGVTGGVPAGLPTTGLTTGLPTGLPTEAELARLATGLFNALPEQWEPGKTCPDLINTGAALAGGGLDAHAATSGLPHSVNAAPKVGGEWQSGAVAPAVTSAPQPVSAASGVSAPALAAVSLSPLSQVPVAAPAAVVVPEGAGAAAVPNDLALVIPELLQVPLPDIRELGGWQGALERETRVPSGERVPSYYFLENGAAPSVIPSNPFASGISVPGTFAGSSYDAHAGGGALPVVPGQTFDVEASRRDFPILRETLKGGRPLVWLDNAATTQKPQAVIDRLSYFYAHENSNIHRAAHELAARSTDAYEAARETVRRFVNARSVNEIIFVRGTTEGINLVAQSWGRQNLVAGDEILITWLEHHANIVPWQQLAAQTGAVLKVAPVDDWGQVRLDEYEKLLGPRTRLVAFTQVSNALGTVTPAALMTRLAHQVGAKVLVDGAQSVSHMRTDVQALDADWFVFSGHKVFGPTGIGAVYGKEALLNATGPWQGGGNMISDVTFERTVYHDAPTRFEAGTGNIADAVGLGAALEYVERIGIDNISRHEHDLITYGTRLLEEIPGLRLIGRAVEKAGVLSFVLDGYAVPDVGARLAEAGIAVRAGHHCAQPILRRFGLEATVRPSFALYNTHADVDALVSAVWKLVRSKRAAY
ncbi:cysteine desulfurase [Betaproteobacteria bacterium]|nr:cysteine desulfurase [Betaproteobacteria bacterium]GHU29705.1 cysteine desulfurase [Betaproteobacteria bacterium]